MSGWTCSATGACVVDGERYCPIVRISQPDARRSRITPRNEGARAVVGFVDDGARGLEDTGEEPGLLLIQIDGLARGQLEAAMDARLSYHYIATGQASFCGDSQGKFWSGDTLPLAPGYRLSNEIAVIP